MNNKLNIFYYLLGEIISKVSPFILIPLISLIFGIEDVAIYANSLLIANVVQMFISGWSSSYVSVVFFRSKLKYRYSITASLVVVVAFFFIFIMAIFVWPFELAYWYSLLLGTFFAINGIYLITRQVEGKVKDYIFFNICKSIFILVTSVFLIYFYEGVTIINLLSANLFVTMIFCYFAVNKLIFEKKLKSISKSYSSLLRAFKFGIPLLPGIMISSLRSLVDRAVIALYLGGGFAGVYAIGYQYSLGIQLVAMAFIRAVTPQLLSALTHSRGDEVRRLYFNYTVLIISSTLALSLLFIFAGDLLLADKSLDMISMTFFLISVSINSFCSFLTCYYQVNFKTKKLMYITLINFLIYSCLVTIGAFVSDFGFAIMSILAMGISFIVLFYGGGKLVFSKVNTQ